MIVGLTGRNASGKGTVGEWLIAQGFFYTSLSDAIRVWLREQGKETTRDNLTWAGRTLREQGGAGVLATRTLATLVPGKDAIVDSVRTPAEVRELRQRADFVLVEVWADERTRYERLRARGRAGDAADFSEFQRQEAAELTATSAAGQMLVATAELADFRVSNDGEPAELVALLASELPRWREFRRS